jgi:hypothetical protein
MNDLLFNPIVHGFKVFSNKVIPALKNQFPQKRIGERFGQLVIFKRAVKD